MLSVMQEKCVLGIVENKKEDFQFYLLVQVMF